MLNILSSYPDWSRMRLWRRCGLDGGWWNVRSHWRQESYFIKLFSTSLHTCVIFIHVHFIYMYLDRYRCCRTLFMIKIIWTGVSCSGDVPNGAWSPTCHQLPTETCTYTCNENFLPNQVNRTVTCGREGEWSIPPKFLCQGNE